MIPLPLLFFNAKCVKEGIGLGVQTILVATLFTQQHALAYIIKTHKNNDTNGYHITLDTQQTKNELHATIATSNLILSNMTSKSDVKVFRHG